MKRILSVGLIVIGSFLEIYYYALRFSSEGTFAPISIIQGVGLTALLMGVFLLRGRWYVWLLILSLGAYSVTNTAVGQRQALTSKVEAQERGANDRRIGLLESEISRAEARHQKVSELMDVSISSFDDAWEWRNTTAKYEEELKELTASIESANNQISGLLDSDIDNSDIGRLYVFYADLTGFDPEKIQVVLQFLFSFFIAIMAPVGITLVPKPKPRTKAKPKPVIPKPKPKQTEDYSGYVPQWVTYNWMNIRTGRSDELLKESVFFEAIKTRNKTFPKPAYDQILSCARFHKVVDKTKILCNNESEAIQMIKAGLKEV